jgi:putative oxidoreductase
VIAVGGALAAAPRRLAPAAIQETTVLANPTQMPAPNDRADASIGARSLALLDGARRALDAAAPVLDLGIRLYVASVFFQSGLTKIANWDSTLSLFENIYAVPVLPPSLAALLGTGVELGFPVLLALGLGSRIAAVVLFVFNIVAVVSYPDLGDVGLKDHQLWGVLLLISLLHGPGRLSLDHLLRTRFGARKA